MMSSLDSCKHHTLQGGTGHRVTATHQTGDPGLQGAVARLHRRVGHRLDGVEGLVVNMLHGVLLQQRGVDRLDRVHVL